jgi:hypothetical protein
MAVVQIAYKADTSCFTAPCFTAQNSGLKRGVPDCSWISVVNAQQPIGREKNRPVSQ